MWMANGSQAFRRDQEEEAVPFLDGTNHDHPFAAEDVSLQRLHLLARRIAFPFARRIPRVTKRRTAQLLFTIWLFWVVVACIEWRAQHSLRRRRKQLVAFLQETTFYVVEEGRLSDGWQSPLQRRLAADAADDDLVLGSASSSNGTRGTKRNLASEGYGRDAQEADGSDSFARGRPEDAWPRERGLKSHKVPEGQESCPLIYTVDAKTAKKHGLILFQEELELLGTVTARLCRCLCHAPIVDEQKRPHQDPTLRRTTITRTSASVDQDVETGRPRRRLGVCEGEAHVLMLEEMLKGANVVISGDSGWFYRWFENMQDAYERTCSHFSTRSTLGIPEGTVLRTVLTGTDMYEDSWFQLEGAAWRPFRHPIDAVRHGFNFMQYKLRQSQVGPLGKSTHTDLQPVMVTFDGCVSNEDGSQHRGGRLLNVPEGF